jgi:hypothetical protein
MELMDLQPELNELRKIIISSHLTTCFLILDELALKRGKTYHYERFREEWIGTYKHVYKLVSKMKSRKSSRDPFGEARSLMENL